MASKKNKYEEMGMAQISQTLGNIELWFNSVFQPKIKRIRGWLHCLWSFTIPKLRLRLPPAKRLLLRKARRVNLK